MNLTRLYDGISQTKRTEAATRLCLRVVIGSCASFSEDGDLKTTFSEQSSNRFLKVRQRAEPGGMLFVFKRLMRSFFTLGSRPPGRCTSALIACQK